VLPKSNKQAVLIKFRDRPDELIESFRRDTLVALINKITKNRVHNEISDYLLFRGKRRTVPLRFDQDEFFAPELQRILLNSRKNGILRELAENTCSIRFRSSLYVLSDVGLMLFDHLSKVFFLNNI